MSKNTSKNDRLCLGSFVKILHSHQKHEDFSTEFLALNVIKDIATSSYPTPDEISGGTVSKVLNQTVQVPRDKLFNRIRKQELIINCKRMSSEFLGDKNSLLHTRYFDFFDFQKSAVDFKNLIKEDEYLPNHLRTELLEVYSLDSEDNISVFLSNILFHVIKSIENDFLKVSKMAVDKNNFLPLVDRIKEQFETGLYFKYIERIITITPDSKQQIFVVENIVNYEQKTLMEYDDLNNGIRIMNNYSSELKAKNKNYLYFNVNDYNYAELINKNAKIRKNEKATQRFAFKKIFEIDNIPYADSYKVERKMVSEVPMPIYHLSVTPVYPAQKTSLTIKIEGNEKIKWKLIPNYFTPFGDNLRNEKKITTAFSDELFNLEINDWSIKGTGFSLLVVPKTENWNYWMEQ